MAYIGKSIESGTFSVLDTSGNTYNGSNVTFNLGSQVGSPAQLLVSHDGVIQKPGTDYTLATGGTQITFTTAPASGASIFIVEISGAVGGPLDSDLNGTELILDADGDTSITADTDDQIDVKIAGADDFKFTANTFTANSGSGIVVPDGGLTFGSTAIASTAAELNIVDGNTSATSTTLADADRVVVNDAGTMKQVAMTDVKTYIGGGGLVLISSGNATNVGSLQLESVFSTTYTNYLFIGTFTPSTNAVDLKGNYVSGTTVQSDSEYRSMGREWKRVGGTTASAYVGGWGADHIRFNSASTSNNSAYGQNVRIHFFNPMASSTTNTPADPHLQYDCSLYADDSNVARSSGFVNYQTSADYNGFRWIYASGNIAMYNYSLFGITGS